VATEPEPAGKKAKRSAPGKKKTKWEGATRVQCLHRNHIRVLSAGPSLLLDSEKLGEPPAGGAEAEESAGIVLYYSTLGNPAFHMMGAPSEDSTDSEDDDETGEGSAVVPKARAHGNVGGGDDGMF
jgi:hypothetical protein